MSKEMKLTRSRYKEIKKMDHHSMECMVNQYYQKGYTTGKLHLMKSIETALDEIGNIKGIGNKKMEEIRKIVYEAAGGNE